jgi:GNAT superfamily N-acetyltransferase
MADHFTGSQDAGAIPTWMLRAATPSDVDAIAQVWHTGWGDGHRGNVPRALYEHRGVGDFRERVAPRLLTTTVATVASAVVGFVVVVDDEIEQLYVAQGARGTGVAAGLLEHGEWSIAGRHTLAWLAVVAGNARARRFYERRGWRDAGPIDYLAETASGPLVVPSRRYEKRVKH